MSEPKLVHYHSSFQIAKIWTNSQHKGVHCTCNTGDTNKTQSSKWVHKVLYLYFKMLIQISKVNKQTKIILAMVTPKRSLTLEGVQVTNRINTANSHECMLPSAEKQTHSCSDLIENYPYDAIWCPEFRVWRCDYDQTILVFFSCDFHIVFANFHNYFDLILRF